MKSGILAAIGAGHISEKWLDMICQRAFRSELPTIWTDGKQRWEESEKRKKEEIKSGKRKSQKKEDAGAPNIVFFQGFGGCRDGVRRESRLAKAAGAEPSVSGKRSKIARRCGAKQISKSKCQKHVSLRSTLAQKGHAIVTQSTFGSQNVKNTAGSECFWKFRCSKSAVAAAKHVLKSKCEKSHHCSQHFWKLRC